MKRLVTALALLISLIALVMTHWLTGEPKATVTIHATVSAPNGHPVPAGRMRFDLMNRSVLSLLDSLCRVQVLQPPNQIVRALTDEGREAFLRGEIERRGFLLSPPTGRALMAVARARQAFIEYVRRFPDYEILLEAIHRVHGPTADIPAARMHSIVSLSPVVLAAEATLYNPARTALYADSTTDVPLEVQSLYDQWFTAVAEYDARYHRDLVERAIVAAAVYRDAAVVSVETDTLGSAAFPPVRHGQYWVAGHYPQEVNRIASLNRLLQPGQPRQPGKDARLLLLCWDVPVDIGGRVSVVELTRANATTAGERAAP